MSDFLFLLINLLPFLAIGLVLWVAAEALWTIALWVFGLRSFLGLHRSDFTHLLPIARDRSGNPISEAPPRTGF